MASAEENPDEVDAIYSLLGLPAEEFLASVELMIPERDFERARAFAAMKSLSYQAYLAQLIHAGLMAEAEDAGL